MAYRIRELREKKKLTQEQLSQMSGVSRATIVPVSYTHLDVYKRQTQILSGVCRKTIFLSKGNSIYEYHIIYQSGCFALTGAVW